MCITMRRCQFCQYQRCAWRFLGGFLLYYNSRNDKKLLGRLSVALSLGLMLQLLQILAIYERLAIVWPEPLGAFLAPLKFLSFDVHR